MRRRTNADSSPQGSSGVPTNIGNGAAGSTGNSGGVSVSGAVTINTIDDSARAYIRRAGVLTIGGKLIMSGSSDTPDVTGAPIEIDVVGEAGDRPTLVVRGEIDVSTSS